jgi:glycosyltransferase involved in cell wall biosynthesis
LITPLGRTRPLVAHLTTTDISLALLLGPQLTAFKDAGFDVVGISAPGAFVSELEAAGIRHLPLRNATRSRSLGSDLRAAADLYRLLRRLRPDILHTHNPKPGIYGRVAGAAAGVPAVVNTVHGLYATNDDRLPKRIAVYGLERGAAAFSHAELVQNPEDLATLRRLGVRSQKMRLLGNGVDLKRFSLPGTQDTIRARVRSELGAGDRSVVVTAIGRLVGEKGYRELFMAAREVQSRFPEALFVVAGPIEPDKHDRITEGEIAAAESCIRFLGYRSDVEAIYAASDVYVLASHREGFPRSAMEAAAMGLPIVASDVRGCRQVVENGRTGLLVPPRAPAALADAITVLVQDPARRAAMGQQGRAKAQREFDQERVISLTLDVYRELLRTRTRR